MGEIERLEKALSAWRVYTRSTPELAPWLESDLEFVIEVARQIASHDATEFSDEDRERIVELAGAPGNPGPIGGFALREIDDVNVGNLLCDAQQAIRRLARHIG